MTDPGTDLLLWATDKERERALALFHEQSDYTELTAPLVESTAAELLEGEDWNGAPDHAFVARLWDEVAPIIGDHPLTPRKPKDLGSAANCGGPFGQSYPSNYGIWCGVPSSSIPVRFTWTPQIWTSGDSVCAFINSVAVTESGRSYYGHGSPSGWGWNNYTSSFVRDVKNFFGIGGSPYVADTPVYDAMKVLIFW